MPEIDADQDEVEVGPSDETDTEGLADTAARVAGDRAREGLEHLQAAARELIAAARAALDVAEDLIDDPETIASMSGAAGSVGDMVGDLVRTVLSPRRPPSGDPAGGSDPGAGEPGAEGDRSAGVQRITIA